MLTQACAAEFQSFWLPNMTDAGLARLIDLLQKDSPFLIHGCFTRAVPMGCLASHIAWNHPETCASNVDAGIYWLHRVAGLNPATSLVIREWDTRGSKDWQLRNDLLELLVPEYERRRQALSPSLSVPQIDEPCAAV